MTDFFSPYFTLSQTKASEQDLVPNASNFIKKPNTSEKSTAVRHLTPI